MYHAPSGLVRVHADILVQSVDGIIFAPVFRVLKLGPRRLDIKLASSQESSNA